MCGIWCALGGRTLKSATLDSFINLLRREVSGRTVCLGQRISMSLIVPIPRLCTKRLLLLELLAIESGLFGVRAHSLMLLMSHGDHLFDKRDMAYLLIRP